MRSARLLALLILALCGGLPVASAQESGRVYRVGFLHLGTAEGTPHPYISGFREGMRALGYVEGRNLVIEMRDGSGDAARLAGAAEELVALKVDLIFTAGTASTLAAKSATHDIPIVFAAGDPVGSGIVASLAHPGGNVTGFAVVITHTKTLEQLKEVVPTVRRLGYLYQLSNTPPQNRATFLEERTSWGRALGLELILRPVDKASDLDAAFADLASQSVDAAYIAQDSVNYYNAVRVMALALQHRLPTVCFDRVMAEAGCLVAYGDDFSEAYRRAASYVDKVLKGARPADLPIQQPTRFTLVLNAKTAKALGIEIPPSLLARADEVIE